MKERLGFDEIFVDCTCKGTKIKKEDFQENGTFPIIDQGQNIIAGYTDEKMGAFYDVPAIVFGDHTRIIKYVDTPFFLGADGTKLLKSKLQNANYKYLYYALKNAKIPNTGYNRHFKWLKEVKILYPSENVQKSIVEKLEKVESIIADRKEQLDKYDEIVRARFVEMFGDPSYNPKGWDVKNFEDISVLITDGEHATPRRVENGIYLLSARNVLNHAIQVKDVDFIDEEEYQRIAKRLIPQEGDVLISCSGSIGRCCYAMLKTAKCIFMIW